MDSTSQTSNKLIDPKGCLATKMGIEHSKIGETHVDVNLLMGLFKGTP